MSMGISQSLTTLSFTLNKARKSLGVWKAGGGNLDTLTWHEVSPSLAFADVKQALGISLPNTAVSIIKVSGDITAHKHLHSNSAGIILSEADGFPFPSKLPEFFSDDTWREVERDTLLVFSAGSVHAFRNISKEEPLYSLFLDSPQIDDSKDTVYL